MWHSFPLLTLGKLVSYVCRNMCLRPYEWLIASVRVEVNEQVLGDLY